MVILARTICQEKKSHYGNINRQKKEEETDRQKEKQRKKREKKNDQKESKK